MEQGSIWGSPTILGLETDTSRVSKLLCNSGIKGAKGVAWLLVSWVSCFFSGLGLRIADFRLMFVGVEAWRGGGEGSGHRIF